MTTQNTGGTAMKGKIGCPTQIVTVFGRLKNLLRGETKPLSAKAKFRLKVFDWHTHESPKYSANGKPDAKRMCRHFGLPRSTFYRWKKRFDKTSPASLENKSTAPKKRRGPSYDCGRASLGYAVGN